VQLTLERNKAI